MAGREPQRAVPVRFGPQVQALPRAALAVETSGDSGRDEAEGRKAERATVTISASLRQRGSSAVEVQLLDLSTTGFRIESVHRMTRGELVWIKIGSLAPLEAKVAWFENYVTGCQFVTPLHPAVLDRIIAGAV